jgi:hypothetical protein
MTVAARIYPWVAIALSDDMVAMNADARREVWRAAREDRRAADSERIPS